MGCVVLLHTNVLAGPFEWADQAEVHECSGQATLCCSWASMHLDVELGHLASAASEEAPDLGLASPARSLLSRISSGVGVMLDHLDSFIGMLVSFQAACYIDANGTGMRFSIATSCEHSGGLFSFQISMLELGLDGIWARAVSALHSALSLHYSSFVLFFLCTGCHMPASRSTWVPWCAPPCIGD